MDGQTDKITISNVTGRHRGPNESFGPVTDPRYYNAHYIFHRRMWYRALSLRYVCIRRSGIILAPRLPLCQSSFLSWPPLLS